MYIIVSSYTFATAFISLSVVSVTLCFVSFSVVFVFFFFFFQAEDGIRDGRVTGVQTCALPISADHAGVALLDVDRQHARAQRVLEVEADRVDRVAHVEEGRDVDGLVGPVHAARAVRLDVAGEGNQLGMVEHLGVPGRLGVRADRADAAVLDHDHAVLDVRSRLRYDPAGLDHDLAARTRGREPRRGQRGRERGQQGEGRDPGEVPVHGGLHRGGSAVTAARVCVCLGSRGV